MDMVGFSEDVLKLLIVDVEESPTHENLDRKSTRLNSSHDQISYAVFCLKKKNVERDKLTSDASFMEDLGADSLDTVELVMAFEKAFAIDIPAEEAEKLRTVRQALHYLHDKMGK